MNLQIRRKIGSQFTAEDTLEVLFDSGGQDMEVVSHTIEIVSGPNVTHGGGGQPNDYLHYKSHDTDANSDGIIDYSNVEIALVQETQGTSVVKVKAEVITKNNVADFKTAYESWLNTPNEGEKGEAPLSSDYLVILESSDISLEWGEDNLV
jgi:hypothetical protein